MPRACPTLVSLRLRQVTRPGLCSPAGSHCGPDQCHCWLWRFWRHGFLMSLHDEPEPVCSAGAAASTVAFESIILGMGESRTCTSCGPRRCVNGHMLTSSRSWTSLLHETVHRVTIRSDLTLLIL